jgi:hypothetical protein
MAANHENALADSCSISTARSPNIITIAPLAFRRRGNMPIL